jgi:hypothetical protein
VFVPFRTGSSAKTTSGPSGSRKISGPSPRTSTDDRAVAAYRSPSSRISAFAVTTARPGSRATTGMQPDRGSFERLFDFRPDRLYEFPSDPRSDLTVTVTATGAASWSPRSPTPTTT